MKSLALSRWISYVAVLLQLLAVTCTAQADDTAHASQLRKTQERLVFGDDNSIIGGTPAAEGEFPYYVMFEGDVLCGGSLISPNRVLTAAHCLAYGAPPAVRVGPTTLNNGEVIPVACAVRHPNYLTPLTTVLNDVAILKLERDVTTVTEFARVNADPNYPSDSGTPLTVAGFGLVANGGNTANTLQKVGTFFVPREDCLDQYSRLVVRPQAHICADVADKGGTYL